MASPECIAAVEKKLGRRLEPRDIPHQKRINPSDDWWQQWFSDNGVPADEVNSAPRRYPAREPGERGSRGNGRQGFALLTPLLWKGDVAAGRLCMPFPERVSTRGWAYWLVFPRERRMVPKVKRFREWLVAEMRLAREELDGGWASQGLVPQSIKDAVSAA